MPRRPPSSASASRPFTSSGGFRPNSRSRPSTSGAGGYFDQDGYPNEHGDYIDEEEEEEEESEEEDVFAYLPPSTAEQEQERERQRQQQQQALQIQQQWAQQQQRIQQFDASQPVHDHAPIANSPGSGSPAVAFPAPTFDPYSPRPSPNEFAPLYPPSAHPQQQGGRFPPVETPPSTASHHTDDPHRMRRINHTPSTRASRASARGVLVSLPSTGYRKGADGGEGDEEEGAESDRDKAVSLAETGSLSLSLSPSVLDDDSREGSIKMEFDFDAIEEEDSPYPEVRASVSNIDDPDMPAMTLRMWVVGLIICMLGSAMNVFFNFRYPAPSVVPFVCLLVSYPIGKLLAFSLPITTYRLPLLSHEFSLNPGPWNIKEHVLVFIMANVAIGPPYALNAIVVAEVYYRISLGFWFNLTFILATQLTGFGLAGLCRRFLVWPASMVWPQNLVACTLLNTLHAEDDDGAGGLSRYRLFIYVLCGSFLFYFLPGYLFTALSIFSWVTWIVPENVPVNQLFGVYGGLGMSVLTFDWNQISWIGSPLMVPWWAQVHIFAGFVLFYWILVPVLYYTNSWHLAHFPISSNNPYDRFGREYNVSRVLQADDTFNATAYASYSPLYMTATYAVTYLLAFALTTCVLVHTALYHGKSLLNGVKRMRVEKDDIHAKLMRNYPEVPDWWYAAAFVLFFCLMIVTVEVWDTDVPAWALFLAVLLPIVYVLPSGVIYAMTGQGISLNLLAQIIPGTLLSGKPMANMVFKSFSVQTLSEATSFVQDLKLGHYIKVPPRATFMVQLVATILAAFVQVGVKEWMFNNVPDICSPGQKDFLTCPHNQVFYTASAIWGLIGPSRQFGKGSIYQPQLYAIIVGAFLPLPFWFWQRKRPNSWVKYMNTPVILNGVSSIPPATGINYSSWFAVGMVFQYFIRRRNFGWWSKFNYVTSAALDSGTALSLIVIFFTLEFPRGGLYVNWWGNNVYEHTADFKGTPFKSTLPSGF